MRSFLCNELEPIAYIIYAIAIFLQLQSSRLYRYKVLYIYHVLAALLLYVGIVFFDDNTWTYNIIFSANIIVSSWYFAILIQNKLKRKIIWAVCVFNLLLFFYVNIIQGKYHLYNNYLYGISFIAIVLYSLMYLHELLVTMRAKSLLLHFDFWLVCAYLLYFLGSFIIVIYYGSKSYSNERGNMWQMHNIILFICSIAIFIASCQIFKKYKPEYV